MRDAANIIKASLGAQDCKLLFCGTGCTGAIERLQEILGLTVPEALRQSVIASLPLALRPLVFVGTYEHHSNEVSWRETIAEVIEVPLASDGSIDLTALRWALKTAQFTGRPLIGSFSAASNVTGMLTDTRAITRLLHEFGALACFDFAAAAPHCAIDMRTGQPDGYDAVFISTHKFIDGPGTPGLLVVNPKIYRLRAPSTPGGGTVRYVSADEHYFVDDIAQREDAGTPGTLQRIRAALAFMIKGAVGVETIERIERDMIRCAIDRLRQHPRIELLGNVDAPRLAILSFLVRTAGGRYLYPLGCAFGCWAQFTRPRFALVRHLLRRSEHRGCRATALGCVHHHSRERHAGRRVPLSSHTRCTLRGAGAGRPVCAIGVSVSVVVWSMASSIRIRARQPAML